MRSDQTIDLTSAHSLDSLWVLCDASPLKSPVELTILVPSLPAITRLSLEGRNIDPVCSLSLIRSCPRLEVLWWSYRLDCYILMSNVPEEIESLPNLLELCVDGDFPTWFMNRLEAPNLERLLYTRKNLLGYGVDKPFRDTSQFPNLRMLELIDFMDSDFPALLASFLPTHGELRRLYLPWCLSEEKELLEVLSCTSLLPNLEYIRMADSPGFIGAEALLEQRVPQNPGQDERQKKVKKFTLHLQMKHHNLRYFDGATRLTEKFGEGVCYETINDDPWSWSVDV